MVINKRFANPEELLVTRKPILDLSFTSATIDLASLLDGSKPKSSSAVKAAPESPPSFADLFPDLAVYSGPVPPEDDKIHKRLDEGYTSGYRIAHTSRIMDIRPILVSSIQPAKNAYNGSWDLHDGPWFEDPKGSTDVTPEVIASTSSIFSGRGFQAPISKGAPAGPGPSSQQLRQPHTWTDEEDKKLHYLVQMYPYNWQLIADALNTVVINVPYDRPTAADCYDRWYWKWGDGKDKLKAVPGTALPSAGPSTSAQTPAPGATPVNGSAMAGPSTNHIGATPQTSKIVSTLPNTSVGVEPSYEGQGPPPPGLSKREAKMQRTHRYESSRKAIRHQAVYETVKRSVRRREAAKNKFSGAFEAH